MAFTKSPQQDTYSTERVHLFREINARDSGGTGKDEDYVNVFIEPVRQKLAADERKFIVKRAGSTQQIASVGAGNVRGMFFWNDQFKLYYCVGQNIYVYDVNAGTSTTLSSVFSTSTGAVGMTDYLYDTNTTVIVATDGTTLVKIDSSNVVTTCTDPDLPTPHVPKPVFLDGYLFLVKQNTADIYNSDLNDPMSWTAGNVIQAEMDGDWVKTIAKINNYLVAFGSNSIEYFWDAANANGSPMQRNDTPIKINTFLGGLAQYGNQIYYIGTNLGGQPDVFMLKDFKIEELGSPSVSRYLNAATDGIANWTGSVIAFQGHNFYAITAGGTKTFVCDLETKLWARWAFQGNSTFDITNVATVVGNNNARTYFSLIGGSTIYRFDESLYQDNGTNFTCIVTTENNDFGTLNRKMMSRCAILGDRPSVSAQMLIQWSDDDYQTFNTGLYTEMNQDMPDVKRLGQFRQRVFKLSFTNNAQMRIEELEVNINKGSM